MEFEITGLEGVLDRLKKLDDAVQGKILKAACKAGAEIIKSTAIAAAPVRSGRLRDNIRIRSMARPSQGLFRASVGVGVKDWTGPSYYATFVLWGHRAGSRKLGGARKFVPGNDFLKNSVAVAGEGVANVMVATINEGIDKANG